MMNSASLAARVNTKPLVSIVLIFFNAGKIFDRRSKAYSSSITLTGNYYWSMTVPLMSVPALRARMRSSFPKKFVILSMRGTRIEA